MWSPLTVLISGKIVKYFPVHFLMDEICSICSKIFKNKAGLRAHKSAVHAEKKHTCDVCDKKEEGPAEHTHLNSSRFN